MTRSSHAGAKIDSGFLLGPWRVEPYRNAIIRDGVESHLENRLMQTLVFLVENQGRVVSRGEFFDSVWGGLVVNEEALSRAISLLRTALGDKAASPRYIQTVPGVGYRLVATVQYPQALQRGPAPAEPSNGSSIAVLPFANLSDDPGNEFFSDGISEEILNVLAQVRGFRVVGRTSSFAFKNRNEDLREIGKTLDVTHVLEGSVRKAGNRVRITAQLIKTGDGYHLWSQTFDHQLDDIFDIQDRIASAVVESLKVRLLGLPGQPRIIGGTENTEAYQAYLRGLHFRNRGSFREAQYAARDAFEKAIELDPEYARAWTGLAFAMNDLIWNAFVDYDEGRQKMKRVASKALELAPEMAASHVAMGLYWQQGIPDWHLAQESISTALRLNPGNAQVQIEFARLNCNLSHLDAAVRAARRALELDPISVYANHLLGHVLYFARRFDEAIPALRQALDLDPHFPKPHYFIAMSLHWLGDTETAYAEIQQEPLLWMRLFATSAILHRMNRTEEARECFDALIDLGKAEPNSMQQAGVLAQWGDFDGAFDRLNEAMAMGDPGLTQLLIDPFLDPLRADPRFTGILKMAGFGEGGSDRSR